MFKKLTSGLKLGRDWWANTQKVLLSGDEPTNIVTNVSDKVVIRWTLRTARTRRSSRPATTA